MIHYEAMNSPATLVPEHIREGIKQYIENHIRPGSFLTAVIRNDLREAIGQADHITMLFLPTIVGWFYSHAPSTCWGSEEAMENWLRPQGESHE